MPSSFEHVGTAGTTHGRYFDTVRHRTGFVAPDSPMPKRGRKKAKTDENATNSSKTPAKGAWSEVDDALVNAPFMKNHDINADEILDNLPCLSHLSMINGKVVKLRPSRLGPGRKSYLQ